MLKRLGDLATAVLVACAVVVTVLVVRRELAGERAPAVRPPEAVARWEEYARHGHRSGRGDAPVVIVTFSDFQCPACRAFEAALDEVQRADSGVAVVYRHLPLRRHPHARAAAAASECAAAQGRFQEIRQLFYRSQDSLGTAPWVRFAHRAGVADTAAFVRCMADDGSARAALARDSLDAARLGASGTPTFLLNGLKYEGAVPPAELHRLVRAGGTGAR